MIVPRFGVRPRVKTRFVIYPLRVVSLKLLWQHVHGDGVRALVLDTIFLKKKHEVDETSAQRKRKLFE